MKPFYFIFLSLFILSSCTSNTIYKKPKDLISKEQMVDLLVDMQLAIGGKSIKNIDQKRSNYMPLVYEKYGIDSARFARSNFYYSTRIDDYVKILQEVKERLDTLNKIHKNLLNIDDSIKNIKKPELKNRKIPKQTLDSIVK